jgi:hypothetical protein
MNKKKVIFRIALIIIIIILTTILFYQRQEADLNNDFEEEAKKEVIINQLSIKEQENIIVYLEENISELSPEKEVLGGSFYINSVDFLDTNNLILEYEDGHISLIAEVNFEYIEEGDISIKGFEILSR